MTAAKSQAVIRPGPGPSRPYHFPAFERVRMDNGMELVCAPVHKVPLVSVNVLVDAGATADPAGHEGVAHLTAQLLLEGTATMDGATLAERMERLGATVDAQADWDGAVVSMTVLSANLRPALDLLRDMLRAPAFAEREVARLKAERLAELLQLRSDPGALADEQFSRFLYRGESRYARLEGGDEASITSIARADIQGFYEARYRPAGMQVIVAGDVSVADAHEQVQRVFGDWRGERAVRVEADDRAANNSRVLRVVTKADAPQSELRIGHVGVPRAHPDYFPLVVMNAVLGGLFSSRINLNLREAHGYTYGAHSAFEWRRQAGPFVVSTAVQTDVTADAAREAIGEIARMREGLIEPGELSLAVDYLDGVFPIRYETTAAICAALSTLVRYELPADYFDTYRRRIREVTAEDVLRVAREHLHPESLLMVAVGDAAAIRGPLDALRFGPMTTHDAEGRDVAR
ncbi:MAG TPA: pitrilysin family protein [Gemmatimonadaceae bacterium]|nr:pitrilysin family protein [Gemmatimonadaceae bacterium]